MRRPQISSDFLKYLAQLDGNLSSVDAGGECQVPSLQALSKTMGLSVASLREQVEVAEALGLVEVHPRTGIRRLPYSFLPAVLQSLSYAIRVDRAYFDQFAELRNHVEAAFWHAAVRSLTETDIEVMESLVASAWEKLHGTPIRIPHTEHRKLHLTVFSRLDNVFVNGILEAYWEAYEAVGLNVFADYDYLEQVWTYHQQMVDAIKNGDFDAGYQALIAHKDLLYQRPKSKTEK